MALLTAPLSDFEIPDPWAQQVQSKIDAILEAERTRLAFAQIFDDIQTQGAAAEMGDVESSMDLPLPQDVTKDAREHAKCWLAAKEIRNVLVNTLVAMEALRIVRSNFLLDVDKIRALVLGFIKPVVRSCLREYASSLVATGRTIPITSFQQQCRDKRSDIDAIEDWGEEYIFGGLLVHQEDGYKLIVDPLYLSPFTISYEEVWQTSSLPLRSTTVNRGNSRPRLGDDQVLSVYMRGQRDRT